MRLAARSEITTRVRPDAKSRLREYFGSQGKVYATPQAFVVDYLEDGARIDSHFHDVDQFQVFVRGDGKIGRDEVRPITFHYADAYTPYGPIVANQEGIAFFTLRNVSAGGAYMMPAGRAYQKAPAGRNVARRFELGRIPGPGKTATESLIAPEPDGMLAVGLRLGQNARTRGPGPGSGGGQYFLVCSGALIHQGKELPPESLVHLEPADPALPLHAGAQGAEVLMMQYPRPSERLGSDPAKLKGRDPERFEAIKR